MASSEILKRGICILRCPDHHDHGVVFLEEVTNNGPVKFKVYIRGISPGKHGFHIHKKGNETRGSTSLCEHFNPTSQPHGDINKKNSHVGDLGNIEAFKIKLETDEGLITTGIVDEEFIANRVRLTGKNSVLGRSLIVHEGEDDLGKGGFKDSLTTGHSGKRILWGIIGVNDGEDCD
jgi:Cu-Zn family superoxide dismutase